MSGRQVPLLDLRRHGADVDAELEEAFRRVLRSGRYILGVEVETLERECAAYIGAKHAIGVSSGTDALLLALMALGVGQGDDVVCPTYTFFATAGTISRTGARPVFADCDPQSFNAGAGDFAGRITPRTKLLIPVHLFGRTAEMEPIVALARAKGLPMVEDAAQAIGAESGGRRAGTFGAFGCFSFFPSKNLGGFGDAGLLVTDDDGLAERARTMRSHGGRPKYHHYVVGGNFRMDALQAALIRVKLARLDAYTEQRQRNARLYAELLAAAGRGGDATERPAVILPTDGPGRHIYNQYVIRVVGSEARDRLRAFLKEKGIETEIYYPIPMHLQECFASLGHRAGDFPSAEAAARETLALPIFPELSADEIAYVAEAVVTFCRRAR